MSSMKSHTTMTTATTTTTPSDGERAPRTRGLALTGAAATVAAMAATALAAAIAKATGVDFELSGGEAVPVTGTAVMTGMFSIVGLVIAALLRHWSTRPATHFVRVTVTLTAISLVPPFLSGGNAATVAALLVLHLVAAAVVIPALARALRG